MTDRRGFAGGSVVAAAGPWRISGEWWEAEGRGQRAEGGGKRAEGGGKRAGRAGQAGRAGEAGRAGRAEGRGQRAEGGGAGAFNRDEWDVRLTDGAVYRIFRDRDTDGWFIEAIVD
jgi:hypothetical protein